jgi:oligopeptide transport system substrate-binding protein
LSDVIPTVASELLKRNAPDLHVFTGFGTYFYSINCQRTLPDGTPNPFHDVRVRQAFAMALDKQPIVDNVTRMGERVATQYIPTGIFQGYTSRGGLGFDPVRAKQLLAEAGYPDGRGFPQITLMFNTGAHHAEVAQIARRCWLDHLGVDVSLEGMEVQIFRQRLNKKQYMIARASWIGDYNDPTTFVDKYRSTSEGNDAGWLNKEYDALLDQAADEADPVKRFDLIAQAEQLMNDQVPVIPVYFYNNAYLHRDHVRGIPHDPRSMVMFQRVEVVKP